MRRAEGAQRMNLFAMELGALLERHGYTISSLYALRAADGTAAIPPAKVARLVRSLTSDVTVVLTAEELAQLGVALGLAAADERRLRAALLGEAVRRLLAGRISGMSALEEGERVMRLALEEGEDEETLRQELLAKARALHHEAPAPTADTNATITRALEAAAEACGQGELWLGVALHAADPDQREDLLALAWNALDRAAQLLAFAPTVAQGSAAQAEWRQTVERALALVRELAPGR
jgi:hypothetical protein